ncbi:hypothetical protein [Rubritalea profundi]|uniref:Uncharacterized protein n=1 Tax=Rubritalea profundi TaxID=1658618 RepID=A0A2S7TZE9_9BACT|nr:hypothetical protein [Rubritalea profundi]PQJ27637.1 hypothetical protein BSZ32_03410 [Rubritalea profundi]
MIEEDSGVWIFVDRFIRKKGSLIVTTNHTTRQFFIQNWQDFSELAQLVSDDLDSLWLNTAERPARLREHIV